VTVMIIAVKLNLFTKVLLLSKELHFLLMLRLARMWHG